MYRFFVFLALLCIALPASSYAQYSLQTPAEAAEEAEEESVFDQLPEDIQMDIIEEAETVRLRCGRRTGMETYHDCDCMAAEFLEERARDPLQTQSWLIKKVAKMCPNIPAVAGQAYSDCRSTTSKMEYHLAEKYCTCVANTTAKFYEQSPTTKLSSMQNLSIGARRQCAQELNIR